MPRGREQGMPDHREASSTVQGGLSRRVTSTTARGQSTRRHQAPLKGLPSTSLTKWAGDVKISKVQLPGSNVDQLLAGAPGQALSAGRQ